jgi:hypothetical protein
MRTTWPSLTRVAMGVQTQREGLERRDLTEGAHFVGEDRVEQGEALGIVELAHRVVGLLHTPHQCGASADGATRLHLPLGQGQQGGGAGRGEAFIRHARRAGVGQQHLADPGGLFVVAAHAFGPLQLGLVGEHATLGHDGQVKRFSDVGVDFHALGQGLEAAHRGAKAHGQAVLIGTDRFQPRGLQG